MKGHIHIFISAGVIVISVIMVVFLTVRALSPAETELGVEEQLFQELLRQQRQEQMAEAKTEIKSDILSDPRWQSLEVLMERPSTNVAKGRANPFLRIEYTKSLD